MKCRICGEKERVKIEKTGEFKIEGKKHVTYKYICLNPDCNGYRVTEFFTVIGKVIRPDTTMGFCLCNICKDIMRIVPIPALYKNDTKYIEVTVPVCLNEKCNRYGLMQLSDVMLNDIKKKING